MNKIKLLIFKVLICSALLVTSGFASAKERVSLSIKNETLREAIREIEKTTEYRFFYSDNLQGLNAKVSINVEKENIEALMNSFAQQANIAYYIRNDKQIVLTAKENVVQQRQTGKRITGTVTDASGETIIGANVVEKGTSNGISTDADGRFSLTVGENATLLVSYIGYVSQEIAVGNRTNLNIALLEDSKALDEVVVTALGIRRDQKALSYSTQTIKSDAVTAVKGAEVATSLTGKISGLKVINTAEFEDDNKPNLLQLRGETALLVIDGMPVYHANMREIAADDIESITVLKGPTASALYGSRGSSGAIMITTKRGVKEGLDISANSNTMFHAGFLVFPQPQTHYSAGNNGIYDDYDDVWGDLLDIGRKGMQYNPYTYEYEERELRSVGKNNLKNFTVPGYTLNNNVALAYKTQNGSFRTSLTQIHQKGYYPNQYANRFSMNMGGDIHIGRLELDASMNYTRRIVPNFDDDGNGQSSPLYTMTLWMGTDWDIRDYKNYWKAGREGIETNFMNSYYNNPYFTQYENVKSLTEGRMTGQINAAYKLTDWLKLTARIGSEEYNQFSDQKHSNAYKTRGTTNYRRDRGYQIWRKDGFSYNAESLLMAEKTFGDWSVDGFVGGSLFSTQWGSSWQSTTSGQPLSVNGFYSLKASVGAVESTSDTYKEKRNAVFGKAGIGWRSAVFAEVTGRNDWSSTLAANARSYFYPSVGGSVVMTELLPKIDVLNFWKIRGSWTQTKLPASIYAITQAYSIAEQWGTDYKGSDFPKSIVAGANLLPKTNEGWEFGTDFRLFDNRLGTDITYFRKRYYNNQTNAILSAASGFSSALINNEEEFLRSGWEITLTGDIIRGSEFSWSAIANWSTMKYTYYKLDPVYSSQAFWVKEGARADVMAVQDWQRDPATGKLAIFDNGLPSRSGTYVFYNQNPDFIWGFSNQMKYRDFALTFSFDGAVGGYGFDDVGANMWKNGNHPDSDNEFRYDQVLHNGTDPNYPAADYKGYIHADAMKVVSGSLLLNPDGTVKEDTRVFAPNDIPASGGYMGFAKQYYNRDTQPNQIHKLTFFKLRELSLGYSVPKAISQKVRIQNAYIALVGQNLLMYCPGFKFQDPEMSYENGLNGDHPNPSNRQIGFNVKLNF